MKKHSSEKTNAVFKHGSTYKSGKTTIKPSLKKEASRIIANDGTKTPKDVIKKATVKKHTRLSDSNDFDSYSFSDGSEEGEHEIYEESGNTNSGQITNFGKTKTGSSSVYEGE